MKRAVALVALLALGSALVLPAGVEADASGPLTIPLVSVGNEDCPQANYVVASSAGGVSQEFLVVPPGPDGCLPGLDVTIGAGAAAGEAVALPLTTDSCQAGTDLLDAQLTLLGQTPGTDGGPGPSSGGTSACPSGDAALAQLQESVGFVSRLLEHEGIFYFFQHTDSGHVLVVGGDSGVPSFAGELNFATGTPLGSVTLHTPGSGPDDYALQPSGTAGVSAVVCSFCR